jgi:chorismate dehydratase
MTRTFPTLTTARPRTLRLGSVSYLNAKPLIHGLDQSDDLDLILDVPANLLSGLERDLYDVALLPVIDYQRMPGLRLLTSGGIGCDGHTLTVRVFSRRPIGRIETLACDTHSHTSVALARIILAERYGIRPDLAPLDHAAAAESFPDAMLLIGDKVVCAEPAGYPHQLDLGHEWKLLTGLPFVFAAWMARPGVDLRDLPVRLERAKVDGLRHVDDIVRRHAVTRGWPAPIARQYLTEHLKFDIGERQLAAVRRFHALAHRHGALPNPPRDLDLVFPC